MSEDSESRKVLELFAFFFFLAPNLFGDTQLVLLVYSTVRIFLQTTIRRNTAQGRDNAVSYEAIIRKKILK